MDPRKWLPNSPLFRTPACVYCGGSADTSDHTPPRCLLPKKLPEDVQAMTVPACTKCNGGFAEDEMRVAAVVCTVSFMQADCDAVSPGGWVHSAMQSDNALHEFISSRLSDDGTFHPDHVVRDTVSRIMAKPPLACSSTNSDGRYRSIHWTSLPWSTQKTFTRRRWWN